MARVTVCVPLAGLDEHRQRAWDFVRAWWRENHPDWSIVTGECPSPWRKAIAVQDAVRKAESGTVIVADADVIMPDIGSVLPLLDRAPWVVPHALMRRLTPEATTRVFGGGDPAALARDRRNLAEAPMRQCATAAIVIMPRAVALDIPGDARFVGWGGQDWSWGWALETLAGSPARSRLTCVHLWHPPQERPARQLGSPANERLKARYRQARGKPERMRALVTEAKLALAQRGLSLAPTEGGHHAEGTHER